MSERGDFAMMQRQREYEWRLMQRPASADGPWVWTERAVPTRELDAATMRVFAEMAAAEPERGPELGEVLWTVS